MGYSGGWGLFSVYLYAGFGVLGDEWGMADWDLNERHSFVF